MVFVLKDIIVIFRKNKTNLILISFKRYFSHPEKSILNLSLSGPPGFTCWISFAPVFSLFTVESLSLLYLLVIS